ncbi:hypothetical protein OG762_20090 [Streptomyces sp. NBC_01136]|nr:hypothetical protein OG762_20090 [Streptomyces sp. NBC_01136]
MFRDRVVPSASIDRQTDPGPAVHLDERKAAMEDWIKSWKYRYAVR